MASGAEAAIGAGAGAGAATGAGAGAGASSFLPQALSATVATREANRSDLFICVLSEKCRRITGNESDVSCHADSVEIPGLKSSSLSKPSRQL
jgi:hypothetical protein